MATPPSPASGSAPLPAPPSKPAAPPSGGFLVRVTRTIDECVTVTPSCVVCVVFVIVSVVCVRVLGSTSPTAGNALARPATEVGTEDSGASSVALELRARRGDATSALPDFASASAIIDVMLVSCKAFEPWRPRGAAPVAVPRGERLGSARSGLAAA